MASEPGGRPKRWAAPRRRSGSPAASKETPVEQPAPATAPETAPETADIYRSLFNELRRTFGGDIDDVNAEAIALAAAELYHKDVEPRLWEHKTAQEILDSFGVPRAGTFVRYSLSDRLLLLRKSANASRSEQAHALLTELGVPEYDSTGSRIAIKDRLQRLLEGTPPLLGPARSSSDPHAALQNGPDDAGGGTVAVGDPSPGAQQLVDALQTMTDAARTDGETGPSAPAPTPSSHMPVAELVGLGTVVAGIQEELIRLREEMETVKGRLDEALALLRAGTAGPAPAAVPSDGGAAPPPDQTAPAPEAEAPAPDAEAPAPSAEPEVTAAPSDVDDGADHVVAPTPVPEPAPVAAPDDVTQMVPVAAPDDVTQMVPVVLNDIALDPPPPAQVRRRRRWGVPALIVIAVVLGLLIAGMAIAISMFGWTEMRKNFNIGAVDVYGLSARDLAEQVLDAVDRPTGAG